MPKLLTPIQDSEIDGVSDQGLLALRLAGSADDGIRVRNGRARMAGRCDWELVIMMTREQDKMDNRDGRGG